MLIYILISIWGNSDGILIVNFAPPFCLFSTAIVPKTVFDVDFNRIVKVFKALDQENNRTTKKDKFFSQITQHHKIEQNYDNWDLVYEQKPQTDSFVEYDPAKNSNVGFIREKNTSKLVFMYRFANSKNSSFVMMLKLTAICSILNIF